MFDARKEVIIQRLRGRGGIMPRSKSSKFKSLLKPKGNYLREFSSITSIHGVMYLGEPKRPLIERWVYKNISTIKKHTMRNRSF